MGNRAILFDLFGTLVNTVSPDDYKAMLDRVADAMGVPAAPFSAQWRSEIVPRETGEFGDVEEILDSTARRAGASPSPTGVGRATDVWLDVARRWLTLRVHTLETIRAFRDAGYRVGLVSNCSAEVPRIWPGHPLREVIEAPVFSCDARLMKPAPAIYERACDLLDVSAKDCIFVGDGGAHELTGAAALGMTSILIRVPGEEHTWFDANYRQDALQWQGATVGAIEELTRYLAR